MDVISNLLSTFHLNASVFLRGRLCGDWRLEHRQAGQASFHLIVSKGCWLQRPDAAEPQWLDAGGLLIIPRDAAHALTHARRTTAQTVDHPILEPLAGSGGTGVVCGYFRFDHGVSNPLLDILPDYLLIRPKQSAPETGIRKIIELLIAEAAAEAPGFEALVDRLSDALFIQALRIHLAENRARAGLAAALGDPATHAALQSIHSHPERPWRIGDLAHAVAMSRSSFIERFSRFVGEAPMGYARRWRMHMAYRWLRAGDTVAVTADRCGYATEAGFSKAFKRHYAVGPGTVRRMARDL